MMRPAITSRLLGRAYAGTFTPSPRFRGVAAESGFKPVRECKEQLDER